MSATWGRFRTCRIWKQVRNLPHEQRFPPRGVGRLAHRNLALAHLTFIRWFFSIVAVSTIPIIPPLPVLCTAVLARHAGANLARPAPREPIPGGSFAGTDGGAADAGDADK